MLAIGRAGEAIGDAKELEDTMFTESLHPPQLIDGIVKVLTTDQEICQSPTQGTAHDEIYNCKDPEHRSLMLPRNYVTIGGS